MKKKAFLSWSSGKDSAWALHTIRKNPEYEVVGLFCTVNSKFKRVAMHGIRLELLRKQAENIDLPLIIIDIPYPCSNQEYEKIMGDFVKKAKKKGIEYFIFGDLFLEDIRRYRETHLKGSGIRPLFPLWKLNTKVLAKEMIDEGLRAVIACLDPKQTPEKFAGKEFDNKFLHELPQSIDPCGENGEFHTFVFDGPMFRKPVEINIGDSVLRDGFLFTELQ